MKLWEQMIGQGNANTLKPTKKHGTIKRSTLSKLSKHRTLGAGANLAEAVKLPDGESANDWIAANVVDFYNELSLLLGLVITDMQAKFTQPGDGFPPGFEYRWQVPGKKPLRVSGPEYCDYVMSWVDSQLDNPSIFPVMEDDPWPDDFAEYAADIARRMFRVFAILFHRMHEEFDKMEATAHLATVFKHFIFFCLEFHLLDEKETKALESPYNRLKDEYVQLKKV